MIGKYTWYSGNYGGKVQAVGDKENSWGLSDMHGNVWEWVWDAYDSYKSGKVVDSVGTTRALRGGSFFNTPGVLRSAHRSGYSPGDQSRNNGFRCARGAGPQR